MNFILLLIASVTAAQNLDQGLIKRQSTNSAGNTSTADPSTDNQSDSNNTDGDDDADDGVPTIGGGSVQDDVDTSQVNTASPPPPVLNPTQRNANTDPSANPNAPASPVVIITSSNNANPSATMAASPSNAPARNSNPTKISNFAHRSASNDFTRMVLVVGATFLIVL